MKILKNTILLVLLLISFFSCRKEEIEIILPNDEEILSENSTISNLLLNVTTNDGSLDNIIDQASCFNIQLPVTVIVNDTELIIENENDYQLIEAIFEESLGDIDTIEIVFPITIIHADFSEETINTQEELIAAAILCGGENQPDDDIECLDLLYPIQASIFNTNNELIETITINSDQEFYDFIVNIDEDTIITFQFPITIILYDGTQQEINDFIEMQNIIESVADACDEDDDNDYDDDDCSNCTSSTFGDFVTGCEIWFVDKLEKNDQDLEDNYTNYEFIFNSDGTINIDHNGDAFSGTWLSSGEGNNVIVTININDLPDFNEEWNLHEIEQQTNEYKVDLRNGDDRLRFESDCTTQGGGNIDDTALINALTTGDWYITQYFDDSDDTAQFADYVFNFATNGTATATDDNGATNGNWSTGAGDETELELNLDFGNTNPLDNLFEDWDVLEVTSDIIRLKDISSDTTTDLLTFERTPFTGGGSNTLTEVLSSGTWFVFSYNDSGVDETADYIGYTLNFDATNGTVVATNGSTTNNGTWAAQSSDTILLLDFGVQFPFDEFNDDWDVLTFTENRVELEDISGGGSGTDTLILEKQ